MQDYELELMTTILAAYKAHWKMEFDQTEFDEALI